jgi:hypothetical protein
MVAGTMLTGTAMPLWASSGIGHPAPADKSEAIQHMVIFDLKHEKGSAAEAKFLADGKAILTAIPTVQEFRVLDQVSPKNDYDFGFSMVFASKADYETYNNHPDHQSFVENRWKKEVARFLEIDFKTH